MGNLQSALNDAFLWMCALMYRKQNVSELYLQFCAFYVCYNQL